MRKWRFETRAPVFILYIYVFFNITLTSIAFPHDENRPSDYYVQCLSLSRTLHVFFQWLALFIFN